MKIENGNDIENDSMETDDNDDNVGQTRGIGRARVRVGVRVRGGGVRVRGGGVRVRGGARVRGGRPPLVRRGWQGRGRARGVRGGRGRGVVNDNGEAPGGWTWKRKNVGEPVQMKNFPFNEVEGLNVRIKDNPKPVDFVDLYLTDELVCR